MWLVTELSRGLTGKRGRQSVVTAALQGRLRITSAVSRAGETAEERTDSPFLFLGLDIPPAPLFKDSQGGNVIAQVPLYELLRKFDGRTWSESVERGLVTRRRLRITRLPPYLVLHLNRFTKNSFFEEKNSTIVTFPVKNLELRDFVFPSIGPQTADEELREVVEFFGGEDLKAKLRHTDGKEELLALANSAAQSVCTKYDLVANICHDSSGASASGGVTAIASEEK